MPVTVLSRAILFLFAMLALASAAPAHAAESAFTEPQKSELKELIKDFMMEHPEVIMQSVQAYQEKQMQDANKDADAKVAQRLGELTAKNLPFTGNPDGDVTVVEFFDYNCGYCKHAIEDIINVLKEDKKVRFVFKELPILGNTSVVAAQWSEAAYKQNKDKFFDFHMALMRDAGQKDEASLMAMAKSVGLDAERLKADANSEDVKKSVEASRSLAMELGFNGTPGFIIGGKPYRGYIGLDGMKQALAEARKGAGQDAKKE